MFNCNNISLIPYQENFGEFIANWYYSDQYKKFFRHIIKPLCHAELLKYPLTMNCTVFMISHKEDIIGMLTMTDYKPLARACKIGMMIDKKFQKNGYALEAMVNSLDYLFNRLNLKKAVFTVMSGDKRTEELLKKGGVRKEATLKAEIYHEGKYLDEIHYTIFKDQFNRLYKGDNK